MFLSSDAMRDLFRSINPHDIVDVLKRRFGLEGISRHFEVDESFSTLQGSLQIDSSNSILMKFPTLRKEYPEYYDSDCYRLLFLAGLSTETKFEKRLVGQLGDVVRKCAINRVMVWTCDSLDFETAQSLKHVNAGSITISDKDLQAVGSIKHFFPIGPNYDYAVGVNAAADLILKRLKKLFHLVLSEIAAPIYDSAYGKTRVATRELMRFEEVQIRTLINKNFPQGRNPTHASRKIAVDVGCGTGRHALALAKQFQTVYGFDFSPQMIAVADRRKNRESIPNVVFSVTDFEYEDVDDEKDFYGPNKTGEVDLVVASFGLSSFVEDTTMMLRRFHAWLRPGGFVVLSFYNGSPLVSQVTPTWRDTALSAHLDPQAKTLRVELPTGAEFHIFCKAYSHDIQSQIDSLFETHTIQSFPTLMALLPNSMLDHETMLPLLLKVDNALASDKPQLGYYVTVMARKDADAPNGAFEKIQAMLREANIEHEVLEHDPVYTISDVRRRLPEIERRQMLKTVVFKRHNNSFVAVTLFADKRVEKKVLAQELNEKDNHLRYANDRDIMRLGFAPGSTAPFGFTESVEAFIDSGILETSEQTLFMGCGDNRRTLKMARSELMRLISHYRRI